MTKVMSGDDLLCIGITCLRLVAGAYRARFGRQCDWLGQADARFNQVGLNPRWHCSFWFWHYRLVTSNVISHTRRTCWVPYGNGSEPVSLRVPQIAMVIALAACWGMCLPIFDPPNAMPTDRNHPDSSAAIVGVIVAIGIISCPRRALDLGCDRGDVGVLSQPGLFRERTWACPRVDGSAQEMPVFLNEPMSAAVGTREVSHLRPSG